MAPLVVLVLVTTTARVAGALGVDPLASWPAAVATGLAAMFLMTGVVHFVQPRRAGLIAIVPPALRNPGALVTATGLLELAGAAGLLVPPDLGPLRGVSAWGLTALLIAMFPANVYAARAPRSAHSPHTPLLPRTVMQGLFIAAALFVAAGS